MQRGGVISKKRYGVIRKPQSSRGWPVQARLANRFLLSLSSSSDSGDKDDDDNGDIAANATASSDAVLPPDNSSGPQINDNVTVSMDELERINNEARDMFIHSLEQVVLRSELMDIIRAIKKGARTKGAGGNETLSNAEGGADLVADDDEDLGDESFARECMAWSSAALL
jgi:hypothetical protein